MSAQNNTNAFFSAPDAYDDFMGRYSKPLAKQFINSIPLQRGDSALDLGCGPGALTGELVSILGADHVSAVDPSPPFLNACVARYPGITGKIGRAEELPFGDNEFDAVMSQLVLHFIGDLDQAGAEIVRVTRPGGHVSVCTWIVDQMQLFGYLGRAIAATGLNSDSAVRVKLFEEEGSAAQYIADIGLEDVTESTITVQSTYGDFEDLWSVYVNGVGPMGPWLLQQPDDVKTSIRANMFRLLGEPDGEISVSGTARAGVGRVPA